MKKLLSGLLILSLSLLMGCVASSQPPAVGVWNAQVDSLRGGTFDVLITMNADGSGEMEAEMFSASIADIVYVDNTAAFTATISIQGQQAVLNFTGAVEGNALSGQFGSAYGAMSLTATRQ